MNGKIRDARPEGYERRSRRMANVDNINIAGYLRFVPGKDLKGAKFDSLFIAAFASGIVFGSTMASAHHVVLAARMQFVLLDRRDRGPLR